MEKPFLERLFVVVKKRVELLNSFVRGVVMSSPQGQSSMNGWYLMEQQTKKWWNDAEARSPPYYLFTSKCLKVANYKIIALPTQQRLYLYFRPGFRLLNTKM